MTLGHVTTLVTVNADLRKIPVSQLRQVTGADGHKYYPVEFVVEVTFYSAYTKYELIHDGVNYGPVAAEYV